MRFLSHLLHLLAEVALGVAGFGLVALGACVWRLSQGPIDITWAARRVEGSLVSGGAQVSIGQAALAWEGFRDPDSPLDVRVRDAVARAPDGRVLASLPAGRVTISPAQLLLGRVVPRTVVVQGASASVLHEADGGFRFDFAGMAPASAPGGANETLRELARPARRGDNLPWLSQLRRIRIEKAHLTVLDAKREVVLDVPALAADFRRAPEGGVAGTASAELAAGGLTASLTAQASLTASGTAIDATVSPVRPSALAAAFPALAPLAAVDGPVSGSAHVVLDPELHAVSGSGELRMGAGRIAAGNGWVDLARASARISATPGRAELTELAIDPVPPAGAHGPAPHITGRATVTRSSTGLVADVAADIDQVPFADLGAYWPAGTGGGARPWLVENVTDGVARGAHVEGRITAGADGSNLVLASLTGGLSGETMTLHWLRPIPPITGAAAKLTVEGPDALHLDVLGGAQGKLRLTGGRLRITGLAGTDQEGDFRLEIAGGLSEALGLLNHPRLKLLSRRKLDLQAKSGSATVSLRVALPLEAKVDFDEIRIGASAKLSNVDLAGLVAGRDLTRGDLALQADNAGLRVDGAAALGGIPSQLHVAMDFRDGPRGQVLEHCVARARATGADLAALGLPSGIVTDGTAGLSAEVTVPRGEDTTLALSADLADAAVTTPLGWSKARGQTASVLARLRLAGEHLAGVDSLRATGPGLDVASHAELRGGQPVALALDRVRLGQTQARGRIGFAPAGAPFDVALQGSVLDLSPWLSRRGGGDKPAPAEPRKSEPEKPGRAWRASLNFDRVVLARDRALAPFSLRAENDGLHMTSASLRAGDQLRAEIVPMPGKRRVTIDAPDSGEVLRALDIADNIKGGKLHLDGIYDDTLPEAPLSGTATMQQFRVLDAPGVARLLKAVTLYGAVDLLRGPGVGFFRAIVPFRYVDRDLRLDSARAYSASLGLTAKGQLDLAAHRADLQGTVVPAYIFNQLLGHLPLVGGIFSPEKGGGVFSARYRVIGAFADPTVTVNPLSALTPGILRDVFGQ